MNIDLPTKADFDLLKALIVDLSKKVEETKAVDLEALKYVSVQQAATITGHHGTTVHSWIKKGRVNPDGSVSYLPVKNWTTEPRILLTELLAFGERYQKPKSKHRNLNALKK